MILNIENGSLFEVDKCYSLAHLVSGDVYDRSSWGSGIDLGFNKRFPNLKMLCAKYMQDNNLQYPCVVPIDYDGRLIFNLITKKYYYDYPTYETFEYTIATMAKYCKKHKIKNLAIAKIGYSTDRLGMFQVVDIIELHFKDQDINILMKLDE